MDKEDIKLLPGSAMVRKKPGAKLIITDTDAKACQKALFVEQIEIYDAKWNKFEDPRGWEWIQMVIEAKDKS